MTERIQVLIADDHPVVRSGLRTFLDLQPDIEVVGEAGDGEQAVERVRELLPDVALVDLVMPRADGVEAIRRIKAVSPSTKAIVLSSFADDDKVFPAIKAGASGYLLKDVAPEALVDAIRTVHRGEALLHPAIAAKVMAEMSGRQERRAPDEILTDRELDVLRLIAKGMSNKEIASDLVLSSKTVKTHVSNILAKLHLADRTQAALYAVRRGLAEIE